MTWQPFDLGLPDEGDAPVSQPSVAPRPRRRIRRRRLVVLPLAIALILVSIKLVSMTWFAHRGVAAYDGARYRSSASNFASLQTVNAIDRWKPWFDLGTARFRLDDLTGAEEAFGRALDLDPDRCETRFNLAVTIEADGDRLMGGNVLEVEEADEVEGLARWRVALDVVNAAACAPAGPDSAGTRLVETRERLERKLGAVADPEDESAMQDSDDETDEQGEANRRDDQESALEERNQTGEAERQDASDINPTDEQPPREPNW